MEEFLDEHAVGKMGVGPSAVKKCGLCDESGSSGCSNDWLGVGYDVQSGSVTTTYWCCSGHNCNVRRCSAALLLCC